MYRYTESGLKNVFLKNGYVIRDTPYGKGVTIHDVAGLHKAIGSALANLPTLSGAQLRFLRKEMEMSQRALARAIGTTEQTLSLWERGRRIPKAFDRFVRLLYLEHINGNVQIRKLVERLNELDEQATPKLQFEKAREWKEAA